MRALTATSFPGIRVQKLTIYSSNYDFCNLQNTFALSKKDFVFVYARERAGFKIKRAMPSADGSKQKQKIFRKKISLITIFRS